MERHNSQSSVKPAPESKELDFSEGDRVRSEKLSRIQGRDKNSYGNGFRPTALKVVRNGE